jgi:hypothetical protein
MRVNQYLSGTASVSVVTFFMVTGALAPAHAYLDPGSGTMLLQAIIAAVGGGAAIVFTKFARIKSYFQKDSAKPDAERDQSNRDPGKH